MPKKIINFKKYKYSKIIKKFRFLKLKLIVIALVVIFSFTSTVILSSCQTEYLDLNLELEKRENKKDSSESSDITFDITSEEIFLELKKTQKDKNPLRNINVRKAIFHAINRDRIYSELLGEYGNVLNSLFSKNSPYFYPAWEQYNYNTEKAKEYLKLAGYDKENPLYITIGASSNSSSRIKIEEFIKEDLEKIGIEVWIFNKTSEEWYLDTVRKGNYELGIWAIYTFDGENLEYYFSSEKIPPMETGENKNCNNFYWYSNEEADTILNRLAKVEDFDEKRDLLIKFQQIIADDAVILPLYNRIFSIAYNKKLKNVDINLNTGNFLVSANNWYIDGEDKSSNESQQVVVGFEEEPFVLNPFITESVFTGYINGLIVKGLWEENENGIFEPVLADEFKNSRENFLETGLKYDVKLKDNIYWEDGEPITARDVKSTWKAIISDEALIGNYPEYELIEDIKIKSDKEFTVIFKQYIKDWQKLFSYIFPESKLKEKKIGYLFRNDIFGCGPYKLKEWVRGEYLLLEKNGYFSGKKADIDYIKIIFNSDKNYLINQLKEGELDIVSIPADLKLMEELEENKKINIMVKQGNLWEHLALCQKPREE